MKNEIPPIPKIPQDFSEKGSRVTTPILWAVVALAYMFEFGTAVVVINTKGWLQCVAAIGALVMPVIGIVVVFLIRAYKERLFYPSKQRYRDAEGPGQTAADIATGAASDLVKRVSGNDASSSKSEKHHE